MARPDAAQPSRRVGATKLRHGRGSGANARVERRRRRTRPNRRAEEQTPWFATWVDPPRAILRGPGCPPREGRRHRREDRARRSGARRESPRGRRRRRGRDPSRRRRRNRLGSGGNRPGVRAEPQAGGAWTGGRRGGHAIGVVRRTAGGERGVVPAGRVRLRRPAAASSRERALRRRDDPRSDGSARGERAVPPSASMPSEGGIGYPPGNGSCESARVASHQRPSDAAAARRVALLLRALIRHAKVAGRAARGSWWK